MLMPFDKLARSPLTGLLAAALLAGCGGGDKPAHDADAPPEDAAEAEAVPMAGDAPAPSGGSQPEATAALLSTGDIDRWEKGMAGELGAVQAAADRLKTARSNEDSLSAMMGVQEMATMEAGAKAAGVDPERYKVIRSNLSSAASYMTPELGGIDTTMLSPDQRAEMKQMNEAQLAQLQGAVPAEVLAALRPRAATLRKQELALVAARLKGAGM
jgi:hypothetical protein